MALQCRFVTIVTYFTQPASMSSCQNLWTNFTRKRDVKKMSTNIKNIANIESIRNTKTNESIANIKSIENIKRNKTRS